VKLLLEYGFVEKSNMRPSGSVCTGYSLKYRKKGRHGHTENTIGPKAETPISSPVKLLKEICGCRRKRGR
jgi:hypothetical protein